MNNQENHFKLNTEQKEATKNIYAYDRVAHKNMFEPDSKKFRTVINRVFDQRKKKFDENLKEMQRNNVRISNNNSPVLSSLKRKNLAGINIEKVQNQHSQMKKNQSAALFNLSVHDSATAFDIDKINKSNLRKDVAQINSFKLDNSNGNQNAGKTQQPYYIFS